MTKTKVMDRPMFKNMMLDPESVGILSLVAGEDFEEDGDEADVSMIMDRRPDSPEILMNTLRGDVRSIDARREELADMVGYNAAMQTPDEVLAMLQPVLAGGINALPGAMNQGPMPVGAPPGGPMGAPPAGPPMPPELMGAPPGAPMGAPPGAPMGAPPQGPMPGGPMPGGPMPGGPMPGGPPPQGPMPMAKGGPVVQNFQAGSDEDGVEADGNQPSGAGERVNAGILSRLLTPAQRERARSSLLAALEPSPTSSRTMEERVADATKMYQGLLGQDKNLTQAQMLFDIAKAGLAFAGNVDPRTGQPLRGSFAARLAGAASELPEKIGARASEAEKMAQQIKLLGIQAAEKERETERAAELKREALRQQIGRDLLRGDTSEAIANIREAGRASAAAQKEENAGLTPARQNALLSNMELVNAYAAGAPLTDPKMAAVEFSINQIYLQPPAIERYTDPDTNRIIERTMPRPKMPDYLAQAVNARSKVLGSRPVVPEQSSTAISSIAREGSPVLSTPSAGASTAPVGAPAVSYGAATAPAVGQALPTSLYRLASSGTGPLNKLRAGIARVPIIGGVVDPKYSQSVSEINNFIPQIVKALQETTRMSNNEREDLQEKISLLPSFIDRPADFQNRLISIDNVLAGIENGAVKKTTLEPIGSSRRQEAQQKVSEVRNIRQMIGLPIRVHTVEQAQALPVNTEFLYVPNNKFMIRR